MSNINSKDVISAVSKYAHSVENNAQDELPEQFFDKRITDESEWMDTAEAARYLRVSISTLHNLVSNGIVEACKLGRRNRYHRAELRDLLTRGRKGDTNELP